MSVETVVVVAERFQERLALLGRNSGDESRLVLRRHGEEDIFVFHGADCATKKNKVNTCHESVILTYFDSFLLLRLRFQVSKLAMDRRDGKW